jgi:hypothetical protein
MVAHPLRAALAKWVLSYRPHRRPAASEGLDEAVVRTPFPARRPRLSRSVK